MALHCFPVAILHHLALGETACMPAVELSKPASVNPNLILDQINDYKVTLFGAAPAFMERVIDRASKCEVI